MTPVLLLFHAVICVNPFERSWTPFFVDTFTTLTFPDSAGGVVVSALELVLQAWSLLHQWRTPLVLVVLVSSALVRQSISAACWMRITELSLSFAVSESLHYIRCLQYVRSR